MGKLTLLMYVFVLVSSSASYAQSSIKNDSCAILKGKVIDRKLHTPIEYASIVLFNKKDRSFVSGTTTNKRGEFVLKELKFGDYYLECSFLGYKKHIIDSIYLSSAKPVRLGKIWLEMYAQNIDEITVSSEKKHIEYKIDKKVINVSKDIIATGGTAVDVLENVPSIKTDLQGNVYLRGGGFTLLIDGKPTVMSSRDLKLIQASTIEKIEIITNPSAKYSPEGVSGIINIITKKNTNNGLNGMINLSIGTFDKYSLNARLNYKINKFRVIGEVSYSNQMRYDSSFEQKMTLLNDTTTHFMTAYDNARQSVNKNIKIGLDYFPTKKTTIGFYFKYKDRTKNTNNFSYIQEPTQPLFLKNLFKETYSGKYLNLNFNFNHNFNKEKHNLTGYTYFTLFRYSIYDNLRIDTTDSYFEENNILSDMTRRVEINEYFRNISRLDYTRPIGKYSKLEAGYNFTFIRDNSDNQNLYFDNDDSQWKSTYNINNSFCYTKQIHSIYSVIKSQLKNLSYKLGLRMEYYTRITEQKAINDTYTLTKPDFFPTIHLQYKISKNHKIQTSYTRRVNRFWGTQLNPFPIYLDANNISKGNPRIQPEYINSFELNYLHYFKSSYFSIELYHRQTNDVLGEIQILQPNGVLLHTYENINRDYYSGVELMWNIKLYKWWTVNTGVDYYQHKIIGELYRNDISNSNNSYDFSLKNTFKLKHSTKIQLMGYYTGPSIYIQEEIEAYYRVGIAIQKAFLKRKLRFTIGMRDVFNTDISASTIRGRNYMIYSRSFYKYPLVQLQVVYRLN